MNHLRSLVEAINAGEVACETHRKNNGSLASAVSELAGKAVCFYLGDADQTMSLGAIPELCKLPYAVCWFEATVMMNDGVAITSALLAYEASNGQIQGAVFSLDLGLWIFEGLVNATTMGSQFFLIDAHEDDMRLAASIMIRASQCFLSALHCSNVQQREHLPDAKLQKARKKRGKAPLFSYWTLQLSGKSGDGGALGSTHASPRVHLRRGHPRQFAPGKWTWVQAHAVGNQKLGMVHKDYDATPLSHRHHQSIEATK